MYCFTQYATLFSDGLFPSATFSEIRMSKAHLNVKISTQKIVFLLNN